MDPARNEHLECARKDDFPFACDPRLFSDEHYALIIRWGHWYQGLSEGTLSPISEAQRQFIEAVKGASPPAEVHAEAWWRYLKRTAIEQQHSDAMHRSHQVEADTFYSRDMAKQVRRTMGGVNLREHKRG